MKNWLLLGLAVVLLIGVGVYYRISSGSITPVEKAAAPVEAALPPPVTAPAEALAPVTPPKPAIAAPSFDVVRVEPTGELVVGGRGEPDAEMTLLDGGKVLDRAKVGSNGQFAMVPPSLKPGPHNLTLSMRLADGQTLLSTQNVAVDVPDNKSGPLLVAKTEAGQPTQLLTPVAPEEAKPASTEAPAASTNKTPELNGGRAIVAITVVEAEDTGTLYAAGKAAPGASVRLYLNDTFLAPADVGPDASWSLKIAKGVVPGQYRIRADDVDPTTGKVLSRAEVTFNFAAKQAVAEAATQSAPAPVATPAPSATTPAASVVVDSIETATVLRGDSLWRISRKTYGAGNRYTEIHRANQQQIRDPDLIYPGQIFVLPKMNP